MSDSDKRVLNLIKFAGNRLPEEKLEEIKQEAQARRDGAGEDAP